MKQNFEEALRYRTSKLNIFFYCPEPTDLYCGDVTHIAHVSQSFTTTTQEANITCCFIETTGRHVLEQLASTYRKGGADILRSATLTWLVLSQSAALELGGTRSAHTHLIALQIISAQ